MIRLPSLFRKRTLILTFVVVPILSTLSGCGGGELESKKAALPTANLAPPPDAPKFPSATEAKEAAEKTAAAAAKAAKTKKFAKKK